MAEQDSLRMDPADHMPTGVRSYLHSCLNIRLLARLLPFQVPSAPEPNGFNQREKGAPVRRERVNHPLRRSARRAAIDDPIGAELTKLLRQDLPRDRLHLPMQLREMRRFLGQPVDDDHLPLAADCGEGRGEWTSRDGIHSAPSRGVTLRCLLVRHRRTW